MRILELLRVFVNTIKKRTDRDKLVSLYESRIKELTEERDYYRSINSPRISLEYPETQESVDFKPLQIIQTWGGISKRILEHRKNKRERFNGEYGKV